MYSPNKKSTLHYHLCFYTALITLTPSQFTYADAKPDTAANTGSKNTLSISQRSRIAKVDNDTNPGKTASILLRLTLESAWTDSLSSTLEADGVKSFFKDDHNDGVNINNEPLIPDPEGAEINQAFVSFNSDAFSANLGRQRINFDNQRFIGGNGFWQNEQTFDAALSRVTLLSNSSFTYAYLANVNRIFGDDAYEFFTTLDSNNLPVVQKRSAATLGDYKLKSHLGRLEWNEWDYSRWVAYVYAIENKDVPILSANTAGLSYEFNLKPNAVKYHLRIEAAAQERTEVLNNTTIPYYFADASMNIAAYELGVSYEVLAAKNNVAFITPLGSLHEFQGWADQFLATPPDGIKDVSLNFLWRAAPFKIDSRHHTFLSYTNGTKLGNEVDIDFIYKPAKKHTLNLRFAHFVSATQPDEKNENKIFLSYSYNL